MKKLKEKNGEKKIFFLFKIMSKIICFTKVDQYSGLNKLMNLVETL